MVIFMDNPPVNEDRRWMEEHVLKGGDMLVYGRLHDEMDQIPSEDIWKTFRRIAEMYLGGGKNRAHMFHDLTDRALKSLIERDKRLGYPPPFCRKGCSNCCHEPVYCTSDEASEIHDYCRKHGVRIDNEKLLRQLRHMEFDSAMDHTGATTWNDQKTEDQSCVFLNPTDKSCDIWPARPLVCRVHLAEETDLYCAPHNGAENPRAQGINYIESSYILTVVFTIHRDSIKKTMGRLLLDSIQGDQGRRSCTNGSCGPGDPP